MRKFNVIWVMGVLLLAVGCCAKKTPEKGVKHVILIGLDGWGAYSVPKANMPNVKKLMDNGSYSLEVRSILPSSSAPNWAATLQPSI